MRQESNDAQVVPRKSATHTCHPQRQPRQATLLVAGMRLPVSEAQRLHPRVHWRRWSGLQGRLLIVRAGPKRGYPGLVGHAAVGLQLSAPGHSSPASGETWRTWAVPAPLATWARTSDRPARGGFTAAPPRRRFAPGLGSARSPSAPGPGRGRCCWRGFPPRTARRFRPRG